MEQEELFNAYLDGKLSPEDAKLLTQLIAQDPESKRLLDEHRQIKAAVTRQERDDLRSFLSEIDSDSKAKNRWIPMRSWAISGIAACIIVLVGYFLWITFAISPGEKLYQAYYQNYPNLVAPTVRGENTPNPDAEAFLAYDNGDYEKAAPLFASLYQNEKADFASFYEGICQLELGRPEKAIALFQRTPASAENPDKATAQWYEALSYLKLNKTSEAKKLLQLVAEKQGHALQTSAEKLLGSME